MSNPRGNPNWQPGASGNPAGRPPKSRALTAILEAAGNTTLDVGDKRTARKRVVAALLWELASTGRATFPDGTVLDADPADWLNAVKWLYQHIDGPPKAALELTGKDGERLMPDPPAPLSVAELRQMVGVLQQAGALDEPPPDA